LRFREAKAKRCLATVQLNISGIWTAKGIRIGLGSETQRTV